VNYWFETYIDSQISVHRKFKKIDQLIFRNTKEIYFGKSSIWHPHLKNVKSRIKKILKRVYFKGPIRKMGAWLFGG
jgi:hypothetical protein